MPSGEWEQSAFLSLIGAEVTEWGEGRMRLALRIRDDHTNPTGVMHGGVVVALMDEAMGGAIARQRGLEVLRTEPHHSVELNASFLSSLRPGDELRVEGRILKLGKRAGFAEAEATRADGQLVAKSRAAFVIKLG